MHYTRPKSSVTPVTSIELTSDEVEIFMPVGSNKAASVEDGGLLCGESTRCMRNQRRIMMQYGKSICFVFIRKRISTREKNNASLVLVGSSMKVKSAIPVSFK